MAATHSIKMRNSDAPAEEVDQKTLDILKERRLLQHYDVKELKQAPKPADLEKSNPKTQKAE